MDPTQIKSKSKQKEGISKDKIEIVDFKSEPINSRHGSMEE